MKHVDIGGYPKHSHMDILLDMKTTVDVDRALADEAAEILGTRSLRETINVALLEVVRTKLRRELVDDIRTGRLSVPTLEEIARSKQPKVPIGGGDVPRARRRRSA